MLSYITLFVKWFAGRHDRARRVQRIFWLTTAVMIAKIYNIITTMMMAMMMIRLFAYCGVGSARKQNVIRFYVVFRRPFMRFIVSIYSVLFDPTHRKPDHRFWCAQRY